MLEYSFARVFFLVLCVWKASSSCYYRAYYRRYYCYRYYYGYSSDVSGGAIAGIVVGVLAVCGIGIAIFVILVLKKCKGRTIRGRSLWGTPVSNVQTVVSYNNTVQNPTMFPQQQFPQQQAYPPTTVNYGMGQGSAFQYGQPPQQYGVPPPAYNTNIGSAPPPTYSFMYQ